MQIHLNLTKHSKIFSAILLLLFICLLSSIWYCEIPVFLKVILTVATLFYFIFLIFNLKHNKITHINFNDERWNLTPDNGEAFFAELKNSSYVSSKLVILHFKQSRNFFKRFVLVFSDQISSANYHQLLLFLRCGKKIKKK